PRKRNRVHEAIRSTIDLEPKRFITRNSGFAITATDIQVDDTKKTITLTAPSILSGAQSQGEIRRWMAEQDGDVDDVSDEVAFHVRAEIIVDPDVLQVVETAIARNTATPVQT